MKKFLMFLVLSLLLVACSTSENGSTKEDKKTESTKDTKKGKKNKSKDESDKSEDEADDYEDKVDETDNEEETKEGKKSSSKSTRPITLKNEVVLDNELFSITAKSIDEDSEYGYLVNLLIENKSPDKTYTFGIQKGQVNGVEVDPYTIIFINPGKKANIKVFIENLKEYGIEEYTDIELIVNVTEGKYTYDEPYTMSESIHIYPYGKENAGKFVYEAKAGDQVLVDNEYVTVIYTGDNKENELGYSINLYIVNKTDKDITVSGDDMSINGYMVGADFFKDVSAGKVSLSNIQWYEETFKENDIDESKINDIEFSLDIYPPENIEAEHFFNGMLKITP
jgi:putative cell wall binding repeat-containing protein